MDKEKGGWQRMFKGSNKYLLISCTIAIILLVNCGREVNLNEFPQEDFEKVIAYKMTGEMGEIIENGKISTKVIGKGELLNDKEAEELLSIFKTPSTYGDIVAKCFEPHVGYVFYGKNNKVVGHSTICLACNWMKITPDIGQYIFSKKGAKKLAAIEKKIFEK